MFIVDSDLSHIKYKNINKYHESDINGLRTLLKLYFSVNKGQIPFSDFGNNFINSLFASRNDIYDMLNAHVDDINMFISRYYPKYKVVNVGYDVNNNRTLIINLSINDDSITTINIEGIK